jgi:serine/threonine-protein kinase
MTARRRTGDADRPTQVIEDEPTASLPPAAEPPPGAPLEEPPPSRALWPWLLVLLVLVIAGLVGAWLASRHNSHRGTQARGTVAGTVAASPSTTAQTPREPIVPKLIGLRAPAALAAVRRVGLVGQTRSIFSDKPRNQVVGQQPAAGTTVADNSTVTMSVSKGSKPVPVPDVTGQQVGAAIETLRAQTLRARVVRVPSDEPSGQVVAQHPRAGATAAPGSAVRLNVSGGQAQSTPTTTAPAAPSNPSAAPVTVPDVRGQKLSEARKALRDAGLVTEERRVPNSLPKKTVVSQSPKPGTTAKRGDHVLVTVSDGAKKGAAEASSAGAPAQVPTVIGEDEDAAIETLRNGGFAVQVVDRSTTDPSQDGVVIDQRPAAGGSAAAGTSVTIYVGRLGG